MSYLINLTLLMVLNGCVLLVFVLIDFQVGRYEVGCSFDPEYGVKWLRFGLQLLEDLRDTEFAFGERIPCVVQGFI